VKFWVVTLKSTLKLVGKAHFVSLRNVFAEMSVSLLCEFVDTLVQHVQKQERVSAAFLALIFEMERFVKRFVSPDVSWPRSRLLGALFGALTQVRTDQDQENKKPIEIGAYSCCFLDVCSDIQLVHCAARLGHTCCEIAGS
jgi:hypothetical protein